MKNHFFIKLSCLLFITILNAQNAGDVDPSFYTGNSFTTSGSVGPVALQSDGKLIVCGDFALFNGVTANSIIRLNADGTPDTTFNTGSGFNSYIHTIAIQADGKVIILGPFDSYNGVAVGHIVRLNTDGTIDPSFITGTGINSLNSSIAIQADGKILLSGDFNSYNGTTVHSIIRLNTNGTIDTTFITGTGFDSQIDSVFVQSDGKILLGGGFSSYNGTTVHSIIRLNPDGSIDNSFNSGKGIAGVSSIAVQPDGKILLGGNFGLNTAIYRLNADGTMDTSFNSGTGTIYTISSVAVQSNGKIIVGGGFSSFSGFTTNNVVRLNSDGTIDTTFTFGTGFTSSLSLIILQANAKITSGRNFILYNANSISPITILNSDGTTDTSFNNSNIHFETLGNNLNPINSLAKQSDGKIIVGGSFNYLNHKLASGLIRLNTDGTNDASFSTGTGFDNIVWTNIVQPDGKILVGGSFTSYNGTMANSIIRLNANGSVDTSFNTGTGFNGSITQIALQSDGKIIVAGGFTSFNGNTLTSALSTIARLNANGTIDTTFNSGTGFNQAQINSIAIQSNGKILVGGNFTFCNTTPAFGFVRLNTDGTIDTSVSSYEGFVSGTHPPTITTIVVQSDGKILVAGGFSTYFSQPTLGIIRLNPDTTVDSSFKPYASLYSQGGESIALQSNGKILMAGSYVLGIGNANKIIRFNPDGTEDISFNSGTGYGNELNTYQISTLLIQNDGKIVSGGNFTSYNGTKSMDIIRLKGDSFLGIEDFSKSKLALYPNPASDKINIQIPTDATVDNITIIDMTGKTILKDQSQTIDVKNLSPGIYILKANSKQTSWQSKFIKE